ncbi:ASCH domain-containing protein [Candidatus Marsarchaeota archaeon]|nr:ASCH domain-containing protein [Candidatus Marsarchaeota archaeon]
MMHEMSLNPEPFNEIKEGRKTIEVRIYDEKRRNVKIGDEIVFGRLPDRTEKIAVKVVGLSVFGSFRDLFSSLEKSKFGHSESLTLDEQVALQREHYSEEEERQNLVVGIHIRLAPLQQ